MPFNFHAPSQGFWHTPSGEYVDRNHPNKCYITLCPLTEISFRFFVTKKCLCKGEGSQASTDAIVHLLVRSQKKRCNVNFTRACTVSSVSCKETRHKIFHLLIKLRHSLSTVHCKTVSPNSSKKETFSCFPFCCLGRSATYYCLLLFVVFAR